MHANVAGHHSARTLLEVMGRQLPGVWAAHETLRCNGRLKAQWPDWCYAPLGVAEPLCSGWPELAFKVTALAAWRLTQGIYRIDQTLLDALLDTPLNDEIPIDVLMRMPEWCIYLELPDVLTPAGPAQGVWVFMEPSHLLTDRPVFLCMLFDTERDIARSLENGAMYPCCIRLGGESISQALAQTFNAAPPELDALKAAVTPVISILLYLCAQNAEITCRGVDACPVRPMAVRTRRHGIRIFPPPAPTVWNLGYRLGAALRAARPRSFDDQEPGLGRRVIPHIRRAHWHTILSGPRKDLPPEARRRELRWMPPVAVNLDMGAELIATVKPVSRKMLIE